MEEVVKSFLGNLDFQIEENFNGHINSTFFVKSKEGRFVLQKINTDIFPKPDVIIENMIAVAEHLEEKKYDKPVIKPIKNQKGEYLTVYNGEHWRMIPFFENSQNFLKALNAKQVKAAAECLSEFHSHICDLDVSKFEEPIDNFINFKNRLLAFEEALKNADDDRVESAKEEIEFLQENKNILNHWISLVESGAFPKRMIHADPKISNYLFKKENAYEPLAIIDWDTLMPGTILYDFGDMVRSFTNNKEEDDPEEGNVFSIEYFDALKEGFISKLADKLTPIEIENLDNAGKCVIYVQAMRFLTDHLNGDVYFKVHRKYQNLDRAKNQIHLLQELIEQIA